MSPGQVMAVEWSTWKTLSMSALHSGESGQCLLLVLIPITLCLLLLPIITILLIVIGCVQHLVDQRVVLLILLLGLWFNG